MQGVKLCNSARPPYKKDMQILFVTSTRVGDAILSTGVLSRLVERYPEARITIACGPAAVSLFEAVPGLERIIALDKMIGSLHWLYLWAKTIGTKWDVLVDLRNAPVTYCLRKSKCYRMTRSRDAGHRVTLIASVLEMEADPPPPTVWIDAERGAKAELYIPDGSPVLAIGPTANWRGKQWRGQSFAELVGRLTGDGGMLAGARVAIFGRDDERPMALPVIESVPKERLIDLVGSIDLLTVAACLKRSDFYIGNDSGLMHLAVACGVPTLGLFGPSPVEKYAPWGPASDYVQASKSYEEIFPENFDHRNTGTLMDSLSVDDAAAAAEKLWMRTRDLAA